MKIKRSPENLKALRGVLSQPALLGRNVSKLSDDQVYEAGECLLDQLASAAPKIAEAGRRMGEAFAEAARSLTAVNRRLPLETEAAK